VSGDQPLSQVEAAGRLGVNTTWFTPASTSAATVARVAAGSSYDTDDVLAPVLRAAPALMRALQTLPADEHVSK
jgi:hypothetical protein